MNDNVSPFPKLERPKEYRTTYNIVYNDPYDNEPISVSYEGYGVVAGQFFAVQNTQMIPLFVIPSHLLVSVTTDIEEVEQTEEELSEDNDNSTVH